MFSVISPEFFDLFNLFVESGNDFLSFLLQFADAEAYFAPCTTDSAVNNCLVRPDPLQGVL